MSGVRRTRAKGSVVLLSGGMDSTTCLAIASREATPVHALTVIYGQRHDREVRSARTVARHFAVRDHQVVTLPVRHLLDSALTDRRKPLPAGRSRRTHIPATYVPARNTLLLALALGYAESRGAGSIYLGINAIDFSGYPDCRPEYLRAFQRLAALGTRVGAEEGRPIAIRAPLLRLGKAEIVRLGSRLGVPWEKTWSCYRGGRIPCGRCDACRLRAQGFQEAKVPDGAVRNAAHARS
ncbi:MAG: 7-cyano-7-deazaguanine synthase QueC [Thermoplasmata archaeon]|nr:7-cyano-7-deazaguanine synthase QueC [Thermoplasmata archaeon]